LANRGPKTRLAMPSVVAGWLESVPGLPTMRVGYKLGLNQCIVRATKR
jgi:hypothetical protein